MVSLVLVTEQREGKVSNYGENGNRKKLRYLSQEFIVIHKQEVVESTAKLRP